MSAHSNNGWVVVLGMGEIGKPLFELLRGNTPQVQGIDVEEQPARGPVDVMHVCYPFAVSGGFVPTTLDYVAKYKPALVVINATVKPGTTRCIEERGQVPCVFTPVRGKHVRMQEDLLRYQRFVAGTSPAAVTRASEHLEALGMKTAQMSRPEALELAKLLETTYFGLLIAWAQEMERLGVQVGADYYELSTFFHEIDYLPRRVFVPGHIGGHCVMPNIDLLKQDFHSEMLDAILAANQRKAIALAEQGEPSPERVEPITID